MQTIEAVVQSGYQVASGHSTTDKRFPGGTIRMQKPFFKERGMDLDAYFDNDFVHGTLNLSIEPKTFTIGKTEYFFEEVKWTDQFGAENFFMSPAELRFKGNSYKAMIYIPDPSTKPDHFQKPTIIEVLAQTVPELAYGDTVTLAFNPEAILIAND